MPELILGVCVCVCMLVFGVVMVYIYLLVLSVYVCTHVCCVYMLVKIRTRHWVSSSTSFHIYVFKKETWSPCFWLGLLHTDILWVCPFLLSQYWVTKYALSKFLHLHGKEDTILQEISCWARTGTNLKKQGETSWHKQKEAVPQKYLGTYNFQLLYS